MPRTDIEPELLKCLSEDSFIEEGIGGVGESCLEKVLVYDDVELVRSQHN